MDPILGTTEALADKVQRVFGKLAIDKRRLPSSQLQKRGIPAYVGEWLVDTLVPGTGDVTPEEAAKVLKWANTNIPGPGDQQVVKYRLSQGEAVRALTPVEVEVRLDKKGQFRKLAQLKLLGLEDVEISSEILDSYPDLLRQGMWGVVELAHDAAGVALKSFRPMQATVNLDLYKRARAEFTLGEWRELMLLSMGYNPSAVDEEQCTVLLARLLPLVQKNMHIMELAPKGTGKSYFFENINPQVRLVSSGNVTPAVLFVNNSSGQWGLLARFAVVVLDEVQTLKFQNADEIIGGLKGYLANAKITRGGLHEVGSDCGIVLLANILLDERQRPVRALLVEELPYFLRETAFLDRIRGIIPGWKAAKLSGASFANSTGLKSDFFGDALLALRNDLSLDQYVRKRVRLTGNKSYTRNEEAIRSMASGLMKIQFPDGNLSDLDFRAYCLAPAVEYRQLIWDQLYRMDAEYRQYDQDLQYELVD
ncbi:MAG: BREX system Lon protease-like protein BrxL [Deltaproteobacteria bacterium]|nr:BREX system Lon protease-like protein BrxL [Deltaproteobacteria bacterium]